MIYSSCIFLDCYSWFSPLQAYFLSTHGNGEVPVLGTLCVIGAVTWSTERRMYYALAVTIHLSVRWEVAVASLSRRFPKIPQGPKTGPKRCDVEGSSPSLLVHLIPFREPTHHVATKPRTNRHAFHLLLLQHGRPHVTTPPAQCNLYLHRLLSPPPHFPIPSHLRTLKPTTAKHTRIQSVCNFHQFRESGIQRLIFGAQGHRFVCQ
jgi:hypothetical protein